MPRAVLLYTVLYMSTRTQIYLTDRQRRELDERARRERKSLAQIIRDAVDAYLGESPDVDAALSETFGAMPEFSVPSRDEWQRD